MSPGSSQTKPTSARRRKAIRGLAAAIAAALFSVGLVSLGTAHGATAAGTAQDPLVLAHGDQTVRFWLGSDGDPRYEVDYKGSHVIENSRLGFTTVAKPDVIDKRIDYSRDLKFVGDPNFRESAGSWKDSFGTRSDVPDIYKELTVQLQASNGFRFDMVFRAYDEGVAFKYLFPVSTTVPQFTIGREDSQFNLDNTAVAYVHPDGHQQNAVKKVNVSSLADKNSKFARPLTVVGSGYAATVTEANQYDYPRMPLRPVASDQPGTIQSALESGASVDRASKDFSSPWRTIILGDNEGQLVERNYLLKTLSPEPDTAPGSPFANTSWIKPGTVLRPMDPLTTEGSLQTIDTMVARNIDYLGVDARWYGKEEDEAKNYPIVPIAGFDPKTIGDYAAAKGKKVILYVNYRGLRSYHKKGELGDLFKKFADWNIDGVKFGFVPVGSQEITKEVYEWAKIAAQHKLVVDIHDEMLTTGLERTYPNILTMEAIRGDEENPSAATDLGTLFTRGANGAADHTWTHMLTRNTSKSFRYAGPVVFYSPLQFLYWYDKPHEINNPAPELWDNLPTTWDKSSFLEAKAQEHATVARKSGSEWWVGSLSAIDRTANIPLNFLTPGVTYRAAIFEKDPANPVNGVVAKEQLVDSGTVLKPTLTANSGYAVRLSAVSAGPGTGAPGGVRVGASVTAGELTMTVPDGAKVELPPVKFGPAASTGAPLPATTVHDYRGGKAGWSLTGKLDSDLTSPDKHTIPATNLHWTPACTTTTAGSPSTCTPGTPGALGTTAATLAGAPTSTTGTGGDFTARADLNLNIPAFTPTGTYTTTLTLTLA
ncbi:glycoside hydrolase family 97 N-terminal domain-containing protein [Streptomyces sp. NBC_00829]|uniref:glycoside hydrolase family 97 N-terminal domain-containing protein n=1 Tax=Streptomyces sp. NBC_00829 TaxID=2903679 RepID=UPI003865E0D1|nr:glycoside hydrolase family 97 protein [Streptomyces sp. NBC_00829]